MEARPTADDALGRLLEQGRRRAVAVDPHHEMLWDALTEATEGGKRFRPALVTSTHDELGGTQHEAAAIVGAGVELLHTAFVIHDDVIDDDHVRRGRPNVSGIFRAHVRAAGAPADDAALYGRTAAILAGDLALSTSVRAVATCGAPTDVIDRLLDLFDAALHTTASGELADVRLALELAPTAMRESLAMEQQKTSAYSFELPLQAGALLAGAGEDTVAGLGEAGRLLGSSFQLVDDLVGVFGDSERSGKSATSDLRTRKQTPLLVHARSTSEWSQIRGFVGRELDAGELDEVRRLLTSSGSRTWVERLADDHLAAAQKSLATAGVSAEVVASVTTRPASLVGAGEAAA